MYTYIESIEDLKFLNKEFLKKSYLAVDTEFRRTTKHNMKLALLQVKDEEEIYLIDTLAIENPREHASFLSTASVIKIFHSCKEDLEAIFSWTQKEMLTIFDTQLANAFLNDQYTISYQELVKKRLGIDLDKKETRSNWIRRPLTENQLKYAALDVEYLINIYLYQKEALLKTHKLKWHDEEINKLIKSTFRQNDFYEEPERKISRTKENELLVGLDKIVKKISKDHSINNTLFFSKKSQKHFLRSIFNEDIDYALNGLTNWRKEILKDDLNEFLKS